MSRLHLKLLFLCCISIFAFEGCKKDKDSKPLLTITPYQMYIVGHPNDVVTFGITVESEEPLQRVTITAQPEGMVAYTLLDTGISTSGTSFNFHYLLPASLVGKSVIIDFKAIDQNGVAGAAGRRVFIEAVVSDETTLTETAGHRMYSNLSVNPDAYDLEANAGVMSTVDSTFRDVQDGSDTASVLSLVWNSPAGGKFVRYNSYDYANATDTTAANAYVSGVKLTQLSGIALSDIIITKLGSVTGNKYVVMRVTDIVDVAGKDGDYYEFSIKK